MNIPEIYIYNSQAINIIKPNQKCPLALKTLYFTTNAKNKADKRNDTEIIHLLDKNKYVTFYIGDHGYDFYSKILKESGMIKSNYISQNHNLYLGGLNNYITKFQKSHRLFGKDVFLKSNLYINYRNMKNLYNNSFNYMANTYYYPENKNDIEKRFKNYNFNTSDLWLIKPANKCSGIGIFIFHSLNELNLEEYIITQYITNINLLKKKKYDLRLFVLISGIQPLRIYFHKEGYARIAAKKFSLDRKSLNDKFIHLTNGVINMKSKYYNYPKNSSDLNANIWNLKTYSNYIKEKYNIEWISIRSKINDIIIKSIISVYHNLITEKNRTKSSDISFYCLLGYDILITDKFEPILLEINNGPDMVFHDVVDKEIKIDVFTDIMNIIGISPYKKRIQNNIKNTNLNPKIKEIIDNAICELTRPRGNFKLIFPLKENIEIYKKYFSNNNKNDYLFWKRLNKM